jgi:hypothetical protein
MPTRVLPVALAAAVVLAGCGGGGPTSSSRSQQQDAGLNVSTSGWRTNFEKHTVPLSEFLSGGPGKDGIPAIDYPQFDPATVTRYLKLREPVIELVVNGDARAYPLQILVWHEIVNDRAGGVPVAVTFCPLCNTALAFDRRVGDSTLDFGTTGNLRHSDLVMYDRQTESWWQQFGGVAVVGAYAGTRLRQLPARIVAWRDFKGRHRDGQVLERPLAHPTSRVEDNFLRPYGENPYSGYDDVDSPPLFPTTNGDDDRLSPKDRVIFVERRGDAVAVPLSVLAKKKEVAIDVAGDRLVVRRASSVSSPLDRQEIVEGRAVLTAEVLADGEPAPFDQPFWFAVAAFRPGIRIVR